MHVLNAMQDTLTCAERHGYDLSTTTPYEGTSFTHMVSMVSRARDAAPPFSEGKINRWLGYMQGVLVASGHADLDEVKEINRRNAG